MILKATELKEIPLKISSVFAQRDQGKHCFYLRYSPKHSLELLLMIWVIHLNASLSLEDISLKKDIGSQTLNMFMTTKTYWVWASVFCVSSLKMTIK